MPRLLDEGDHDWEQRRSTLVVVQNGGWTTDLEETRSGRVVLDIVRTLGGDEGLTRPQIVAFAEEQNLSRSSAYTAVGTLVRAAAIRNIGTEKRPRYVVAGATTLTEVTS